MILLVLILVSLELYSDVVNVSFHTLYYIRVSTMSKDTRPLDKTQVLRYISWCLILHQLFLTPISILHAIAGSIDTNLLLPTNQTVAFSTQAFLSTSYVVTLVLIVLSVSLAVSGAIYVNIKVRATLKLSSGLLIGSLLLDVCIIPLEISKIVLITTYATILTPFVYILLFFGLILILFLFSGLPLKILTFIGSVISLKSSVYQ